MYIYIYIYVYKNMDWIIYNLLYMDWIFIPHLPGEGC